MTLFEAPVRALLDNSDRMISSYLSEVLGSNPFTVDIIISVSFLILLSVLIASRILSSVRECVVLFDSCFLSNITDSFSVTLQLSWRVYKENARAERGSRCFFVDSFPSSTRRFSF